MTKNKILLEDLEYTFQALDDVEKKKLCNSTILITGCGGFLGQYQLSFFERYANDLQLKKIIGIDTFLLGVSPLIKRLKNNPLFDIRQVNAKNFSDSGIATKYDIDYIIHMASIASPSYYRLHPLETIDSNIWGIRNILDSIKDKHLKGFLFYSSSEIYGNPVIDKIPTDEEYCGNVECLGPRACYDESKRFGETICWVYHKLYRIPVRIVRLFNVYGPGLKMNDKRAPADFAMSVMKNKNIEILSNGKSTRTFCYVADSCIGELKALLSDNFEVYNIGNDKNEMTIEQFANMYKDIAYSQLGYMQKCTYSVSDDPDYLVHDPQRRCPNIEKSRKSLGYIPKIQPKEGILRYLKYLKEEGDNCIW